MTKPFALAAAVNGIQGFSPSGTAILITSKSFLLYQQISTQSETMALRLFHQKTQFKIFRHS